MLEAGGAVVGDRDRARASDASDFRPWSGAHAAAISVFQAAKSGAGLESLRSTRPMGCGLTIAIHGER
jgi:hypothetical protein